MRSLLLLALLGVAIAAHQAPAADDVADTLGDISEAADLRVCAVYSAWGQSADLRDLPTAMPADPRISDLRAKRDIDELNKHLGQMRDALGGSMHPPTDIGARRKLALWILDLTTCKGAETWQRICAIRASVTGERKAP